jgi:RNA polymerase sporulation-specific sigma factor
MTDDTQDQIELAQHSELMTKLVARMKDRLDEREYKIIALRYGIENNIALPQREVAKKMNISRSYISRIEKHAIEIIREIIQEKEFKNGFKSEKPMFAL